MDKIMKDKRGVELVLSRSSCYKWSSEKLRKMIYNLTKFDDVK